MSDPIYEDAASGKRDDRPGLAACLKALREGDTLVVWKLDRLGRDLRHLVNTVHDLTARGIGFKVLSGHGASIDTTSPSGKLVFGIFAALAEFERVARLLKLLGNEVRTVHDGLSAIEAARIQGPDFVLLDLGLPGMDGYEVARRLREVPGCQAAVIIAVSGYGQEEDRRRSREAGFDHHLVKPVDFDRRVTLMTQVS